MFFREVVKLRMWQDGTWSVTTHCRGRWWFADVVGLQVGLGVVERGGHDLKLFGKPPKIFKLGLIVGDKSPTIISRLTHPQPDLPPDE